MNNHEKRVIINPDTGELVGVFTPKRRARTARGVKFMLINQSFMEELGRRKDFGLTERRVLEIIIGRVEFNNLVLQSQTQIAEMLGMHTQQVNRAMKRLEQIGVIRRGFGDDARARFYTLSPHVGWKGRAEDHRRALKDYKVEPKLRVVS